MKVSSLQPVSLSDWDINTVTASVATYIYRPVVIPAAESVASRQ